MDDDLDLICVHLVEEAGRNRVVQVEAESLDEMNTPVAQPVVALGGARQLIEHDDLVIGVLHEVLNRVVANEAAAAGDEALGLGALGGARGERRRQVRLGHVRRRERLHRVHHALPHWLGDPPADGQADKLLGELVELRQHRREARDARVDVVALVDGGYHDAAPFMCAKKRGCQSAAMRTVYSQYAPRLPLGSGSTDTGELHEVLLVARCGMPEDARQVRKADHANRRVHFVMWNLRPAPECQAPYGSRLCRALLRSMPNQRSSLSSYRVAVGSVSMPPSMEVRCLMAWSEKQHRLPWLPSFRPRCSAPIACAQSSMTRGRKPKRAMQTSCT